MYELAGVDYKILKFILERGLVSKEDIFKKFPEKNFFTSHRLKLLSKKKYVPNNSAVAVFKSSNESIDYLESEEITQIIHSKPKEITIFTLTNHGKKVILDYTIGKQDKNLDYMLKAIPLEMMRSVLFPIVVAFITALITSKYFN